MRSTRRTSPISDAPLAKRTPFEARFPRIRGAVDGSDLQSPCSPVWWDGFALGKHTPVQRQVTHRGGWLAVRLRRISPVGMAGISR